MEDVAIFNFIVFETLLGQESNPPFRGDFFSTRPIFLRKGKVSFIFTTLKRDVLLIKITWFYLQFKLATTTRLGRMIDQHALTLSCMQ